MNWGKILLPQSQYHKTDKIGIKINTVILIFFFRCILFSIENVKIEFQDADWPFSREFHYWLLDQYFINFNAISTSIRIQSICFISPNQNVSDSGCYSFCHSFSEWNLCSESLLCVGQIERTQRDNGLKMHLLMHKGNEIPLKCIENQINASLCKELQWKNNG